MTKTSYLFYPLLLGLLSCRKPYIPPAIAAPDSYLVVEGVINPGSDSTVIKLSKTVNLNAKTTLKPVLGATVTVENDQNNKWPLVGDGAGNYISAGLNLPLQAKYRLSINTGDGQQYQSDFVPVKLTPPIDSVGYKLASDRLNIYVNTHDPANNTRYYRWDYTETWKFHAKFFSDLFLDTLHHVIVDRDSTQQVYYCFASDQASNIVLGSTQKLAQDVVYQSPVTNVLYTSPKLEIKYSILVKQYALTGDAYTFYNLLKQNTEQLGTIFDAQPSELTGNIHDVTKPAEPVIGYVSVTNVQTKRIFISNDDIPLTLTVYPYYCEQDTVSFYLAQDVLLDPPYVYLPTIYAYTPKGALVGYLYSRPICLDCTLTGSKKTPSFWK